MKMYASVSVAVVVAALCVLPTGNGWAQDTVNFGSLTTIAGVGDLDLSGTFVYAIDVGGPGRTVGGLMFDRDDEAGTGASSEDNQNAPGTTPSSYTPGYYPCMNDAARGGNDPNTGDESLDELLQYMRNDSADFRVIQLDVTIGTTYKLQVLALSSSDENRRFDLAVGPDSGAANADSTWRTANLAVKDLVEQNPRLWTWTFTATTNSLWINCGKNNPQTGTDPNPCLSAITLEDLDNPPATATLVTYPGPAGEAESTDYSVSVNGQPLFIYGSWQKGPLNHPEAVPMGDPGGWRPPVSPVSFCYFDFGGGPVTITVEINDAGLILASQSYVSVKPLARGIRPTVTNGVFSFTITEPGPITIQPGGNMLTPSLFKPLHIFANPLEVDPPPSEGGANVTYYSPGVHGAISNSGYNGVFYFEPGQHIVDRIDLTPNQTLYIAGGAVVSVSGTSTQDEIVNATGADHIAVMGRGIICGRARRDRPKTERVGMIKFIGSRDIEIEGVILRESTRWNLFITDGSQDVVVDNVKIISPIYGNDGIVISGTTRAVIKNCFCHNSEDGQETKSWNPGLSDIEFRNCVAWSTLASAFGHCAETEANATNVRFIGCTVINADDNRSARGTIGISARGPTSGFVTVSDYLFEDMVIEYVRSGSYHKPAIRVMNNWADDPQAPSTDYELNDPDPDDNRPRAPIDNVTFRNINIINAEIDHVVVMADAEVSPISNVTFENVIINGTPLVPGDSRLYTNEWVYNLTVLFDSTPPEIDSVVSTNQNQIRVLFSEEVQAGTATGGAERVTNYSVNNGIAISSAVLLSDKSTVILTTSTAIPQGVTHELTVNNVEDRSPLPNPIVSPTVTSFVRPNSVPVADAGTGQLVFGQPGSYPEITLNGSGSDDPDSGPAALTYAWTKLSGPAVTITDNTTAIATFTPSVEGVYVLQLQVSDSVDQDTDTVTVTVLPGNPVPFQESFESYSHNASVIGTNGWYADRATDGVVVTHDYTGNYGGAFPIPGAEHARVLTVAGTVTKGITDAGSKAHIWLDMLMECHRWSSPTPPANESRDQLVLYVNSDGKICVWNDAGSSNNWTEIPGTSIDQDAWIRLTLELDYGVTPARFRVYKNGTAIPDSSTWFNVANDTKSFLSGMSVAGGFHLDDLVVSDYDPQSAFIAWMRQHYPGTYDYNSVALNDTDGDGMVTEDEYHAGTDPTNWASVFAIIEMGRTGASNSVTWYGTSNNVSTPFAIYRATNLLDVAPWSFVTNVTRDPLGTGVNQWWDESPPSNAPSFYRVVAPAVSE
jgi:hypothetical protein